MVSPGMLDLQIPINAPDFASGTLYASLDATVSLPHHYPIEVWVVDGAGHESNHLQAAFDVVPHTSCTGWTTATTGGPILEDLVWTGARFVGVGATAEATPLTAVGWSGTGLVAFGDGVILTSPDGIQWTRRSLPADDLHVEAVLWTGERFVAAGRGGMYPSTHPAILTSADGVTWTERSVPVPPSASSNENRELTGLAWSGSRLVASSIAWPLAVFVSPDGVDWQAVEIPPTPGLPETQVLFDVASLDGGFAAVGVSDMLFTSPDGLVWTQHSPEIFGFLYEAVSTGPTLVAGGWPIVTCDLAAQCNAEQPPLSAEAVRALVWSGVECVAARHDGTILVSP
jgi:hypothetical protein